MADYRDLAAALGGGYGQDTGGITPDTLATLRNGKTASASDLLGMLKAIGSGSLSNLESLVRGGVAQIPGMAGDLEGLARMGINKLYGAGGVNVSPTPVLPTSADILGMMPRGTATRQETAGMEELGGYMTPATAKVVKPAVMATGRLAGQEINAAMTGQPTRSLLGTITPKPKLLDVYHGTPHTLPPTERNPLGEFDASKIGTGEGAQAYGYGIYTAEAPTVAREYQQKLSSVASAKNLASQYGGVDEGLTEAMRRVENYKKLIADGGGGAMERVKSLLQISEKNVEDLSRMKAGLPENTGNLYKIDLPDEKIATMLDWDKPVSQQKNVMNALRNEAEQRVKNNLLVNIENDIRSQLPAQDIGNDYTALFGGQNVAINQDIRQQALSRLDQLDLKPLVDKELESFKTPDMTWNMSGGELYQTLATRNGSQQQASSILKNQGIAGIKYFDEGSRGPTGQGRWKVTFKDGKEKIMDLKPNDEVLQSIGATVKPHGTRNFVVFPGEEKNMTILERNAEKITK
jgi:hypothetical protein